MRAQNPLRNSSVFSHTMHWNAGWRVFVLMVAFLLVALPVLAIDYNLLAPVSKVQTVGGPNIFGDYMANFIPFVLVFAAMAAVVQIVIGGFEYALSEAITSKEEAKDRMMSALFGLGLALASFLILNTINPKLTSLQLEIPPITTKTAQQPQQQAAPEPAKPWKLQTLVNGQWTDQAAFEKQEECEAQRQSMVQVDYSKVTTLRCINQ